MTDALPPPASPASRLDEVGKTISKYVAIIAALISVTVPLTEWLRGISNQKIKEAEQKSALAVTYLDKIASKDTTSPDRIMYLSALSKLGDHPLQSWAIEQQAIQKKQAEELSAIIARGNKALEASSEAQAELEAVRAEIEVVTFKMNKAQATGEIEPLEKRMAELIARQRKLREAVLAQAREASTAGVAVAAATDNQRGAADFLSAVQDLRRAASTSTTAKTLSLDNTPTGEAAEALNYVVDTVASPVEKHFGARVEILSGYRSPALNQAVGGVSGSSHSKGEAIDIRVPGFDNLTVACWIRDNLDYDELTLEGNRGVHVATKKSGNRRVALTQIDLRSPPKRGIDCPAN